MKSCTMVLLRTFLVVACLVGICVTQVLDEDGPSSIKRSIGDNNAVENSIEGPSKEVLIDKNKFEKFVRSIKLVGSEGCKKDLNVTLYALMDRVPWAVSSKSPNVFYSIHTRTSQTHPIMGPSV